MSASAATRNDFPGACGVCDRYDRVDQFCTDCSWCFHMDCYSGHEHSQSNTENAQNIPMNATTIVTISGNTQTQPLEPKEEDFVLRLSRFPYNEYIFNINQDKTNSFSNERQYFQDVTRGVIVPALSGKWVAYIKNQWWKNKLYDSEEQIYQDKEFTTEMYRIRVCYIVRVGYELSRKI